MCDECEPDGPFEGKGAYLLLISLSTAREIAVGRLGTIHFEPGGYTYAGSALGGLKGRIGHHMKKSKKPYWHIDYLLEFAHIDNVMTVETSERLECAAALMLSKYFEAIPNFGSSDCKCKSHLFYGRDVRKMYVRAVEAMNLLSKRL